MPLNFKGIKTTGGRSYREDAISALNDSLSYLPPVQRAAVLGSIIEESGGDPLAKSKGNTYQGLLQWGADRYKIADGASAEEELLRQLQYLHNSLKDTTDGKSWTHGGKGSGYSSFRDTYGGFHDPNSSLEDAFRAFSFGYVRPKGKEDSYNNRLKVAQQVYDRIKSQVTPQNIWLINRLEELRTTNPLNHSEGGQLQRHKMWNDLSMAEKSEMICVAVRNGITDLPTIRQKYNEFAEGGSIHIDPSKKGTFTAASKHGKSVQAFASQVLAHPENYSPAMRRKANFARNASKWKHSLGCPMVEAAMNYFDDGGEKSPFTPIRKPVVPQVEGDQEAVNWLANWYIMNITLFFKDMI